MRKPVQNLGASVRARLLNLAKERNQPFEILLTRYALEQLLYRQAECLDGKRWQTETTLRRDSSSQPEAPQRLRLQFAYGTLKQESLITLGLPSQGLPDY